MTLFDPGPGSAVEREQLSADRRRKIKNDAMLANGVHPATRHSIARGELRTCGECEHAMKVLAGNRSYWKCERHRLGQSASAASDIRVSWPACALFAPEPVGTNAPGKVRADAPQTSRDAAAAVLPKSGSQRRRVYDALVELGGATDAAVEARTGLSGNSVRPRRIELVEKHLVRDSGRRQRLASGLEAIVWEVTDETSLPATADNECSEAAHQEALRRYWRAVDAREAAQEAAQEAHNDGGDL